MREDDPPPVGPRDTDDAAGRHGGDPGDPGDPGDGTLDAPPEQDPLPLPGEDDLEPHVPRFLPWRRGYGREQLARDSIAGALVAILLIPQAFAYAQLADLPPSAGIAAALVAPVVYALFGASCYLAVGPVALVSLLVGDAAGGQDPVAVGLVLAAMSGAILFLLGLFRTGFLFRVFTRPVMSGFVSAAAVVIATTQLEHILAVPLERGMAPLGLWLQIARNLGSARLGPALLGFGVLAALLLLPRLARRLLGLDEGQQRGWRPNLVRSLPLVILLAAAAVVWAWGLEESHGVATLGRVDLPNLLPALPPFLQVDWLGLVVPAFSIALVAAVTTLAIAETLAAQHGEEVSNSRELFALGLASAATAFTGGYPVGGSLSRSAVVCDSGGRSPVAATLGAVALGLAAVFLSPVLGTIPRAALSALIFSAALSMVDVKSVRRFWKHDRSCLLFMAAPFVAVLAFGVQAGLAAAFVAGAGHLGWQRWRANGRAAEVS